MKSREIYGFPFYALIMAAMRQADDINSTKLSMMFPGSKEVGGMTNHEHHIQLWDFCREHSELKKELRYE
jgi:hypothetical protein